MTRGIAATGCARYDLTELGGEIAFSEGVVFKFVGEKLVDVEVKRLQKT